MMHNKHEAGVGALVMIVIVAVLAIGGVTAYQMSQDATVAVDDESEVMSKAQTDAAADIKLQTAELRANLSTGVGIDVAAAQRILTNIKADLLTMKSKVDVQAATELEALEARLATVAADIEATGEVTESELEAVLADIDAKIDAMLASNANAAVSGGDDSERGAATTQAEGESEMNDDEADTNAAASVDATTESNITTDEAVIEIDAAADAGLNL